MCTERVLRAARMNSVRHMQAQQSAVQYSVKDDFAFLYGDMQTSNPSGKLEPLSDRLET